LDSDTVKITIDNTTVEGDLSSFIRQKLISIPDHITDEDRLEILRAFAIVVIDTSAEICRQQWATPGDLMSAIYRQKQLEVKQYYADLIKVPEDYPLMNRRAIRLNVSLATVAADWAARAMAFIAITADIEDMREQAKEDIAEAVAIDEIETILAELDWPEP
jgi:hypothetical protein